MDTIKARQVLVLNVLNVLHRQLSKEQFDSVKMEKLKYWCAGETDICEYGGKGFWAQSFVYNNGEETTWLFKDGKTYEYKGRQ